MKDDHFFKSEVFLLLDFHPPCFLVFVVFFSFPLFAFREMLVHEKREKGNKKAKHDGSIDDFALLCPFTALGFLHVHFFFVLQGWFIRFSFRHQPSSSEFTSFFFDDTIEKGSCVSIRRR